MPRFPFASARHVLSRGLSPLVVVSALAEWLAGAPVLAQSATVSGSDPGNGPVAAADAGPDFFTGLFAPSRNYLLP